jgi:hypothetical protein
MYGAAPVRIGALHFRWAPGPGLQPLATDPLTGSPRGPPLAKLVTSCAPPRPSQHAKHNCHQAFALLSQSDGIDSACPPQCPSTAVTTTGSVFDIRLLKCSGAKGTRTPGLLHAIHARAVARWGLTSPRVLFTCSDCGWM